jgi:hypothetical protein
MNSLVFGLGLIALGFVVLLAGRRRSKRVSVRADRGSVAVGGKSTAPITNINTGQEERGGLSEHWLTIVVIIVEIIGIVLAVSHLVEQAHR